VSFVICSHTLRVAKGGCGAGSAAFVATRWAADRFPIVAPRDCLDKSLPGLGQPCECLCEYPTCRQFFAALLVMLEMLGESPG